MKKIITILLAISVLLSVVSACTDPPDNESNGDNCNGFTETVTVSTDEMTETQSEAEHETEKDAETWDNVSTLPPVVLSKASPDEIVTALAPDAPHLYATAECKMAIVNGLTKDAVIKAFTDEDFSRPTVYNVEYAKFETVVLIKSNYVVTVYAFDSGEIRILWENSRYNYNAYLRPNSQTGKEGGTVTNIGVDRAGCIDNPMIGICTVTKLSDGRAIIFDGGCSSPECAKNIFHTLRKLAIKKNADGEYIIAAWIFSHSHGDHTGAFEEFGENFAKGSTVESVFYNIPHDTKLFAGAGSPKNVEKTMAEYYPEAKRVNPHAGLKYFIGNATIRMLYTPDMLMRDGYKVLYSNDMSIIYTLEIGGAKILYYGDSGNEASKAMWNAYEATAFRSDVLQISHHGLYMSADGKSDGHEWEYARLVYTATMAKYAILPTHTQNHEQTKNGRYTVLIQWSDLDRQISFVTDKTDNHGISKITLAYFEEFVASAESGTKTHDTLYGYDGINKIVNSKGLITYMGSADTYDMVTTFDFCNGEVSVIRNERLSLWL